MILMNTFVQCTMYNVQCKIPLNYSTKIVQNMDTNNSLTTRFAEIFPISKEGFPENSHLVENRNFPTNYLFPRNWEYATKPQTQNHCIESSEIYQFQY